MSLPLVPYLVRNYPEIKQQHPTEGRRKWRLRVAQQFWSATRSGAAPPAPHDSSLEVTLNLKPTFVTDPDPMDAVSSQAPELGVVVRTDYSDDSSWATFCARLEESEKELMSESEDQMLEQGSSEPTPAADNDLEAQGDSDEDEDDEDSPPPIFQIVNPTSPQERELFANISNLTALRLFNDVDVRTAPSPPQGTRRISPPNRLVDCEGWQEIYLGKNVWIYDTQSNTDQCVRVISQSGDLYGTATGDSWRARVSHICELQVNLSSGAMRIDFGGLDRWDFGERQRNMKEAEQD